MFEVSEVEIANIEVLRTLSKGNEVFVRESKTVETAGVQYSCKAGLNCTTEQLFFIGELTQTRRQREEKRRFKMTSRSFKLLRDYSDSFNLSNVAVLSRS